ncbi:transient receptor potential cation channel protein painless-like, partial [Temnothorax curvispinosus]|uniref:Transient receptor potential cation channel protein painless-like n=1 Tax=Temnothorax curvispinosus TaxID=300111 RepID=A0A6J1R7M0_9HYME
MDFRNKGSSIHRRSSLSRRLSTTKERIIQSNIYSPISMQDDLYKLELNAEQFEDFSFFKNAIKDNLKKHAPLQSIYINPTYLKETCLDIASKNGLTEFVNFLLRNGANPNKINDAQHRAPIHFATEGGHADTLEALFQHPKINPNLQVEGRTALHIAVENIDLKCARLLLERGAGANIPDSEGRTALQLATTTNQWDMVALIVQKCLQFLNLDEYKANGDQTLREVIQQTRPELALPPIPEDTQEVLLQDLKNYLSVNDEDNFMKNIILLRKEFPHEMVEDLLKIAAERDFHKAVRAIKKQYTKKSYRSTFILSEAISIAFRGGYCDTLRELLDIGSLKPDVANDLILSACTKLKILKFDAASNHLECLKLILETRGVSVRFPDSQGNTPLHYAAREGCREAITLFLKHGSCIGYMNRFNEPPIAQIPTNMLLEHFDNCVRLKDKSELEFDYRCLMPHETGTMTCEMETFMYITREENLKHLLKHPLLSSFLYIKWYRIRYFLYANFFFYFIFYLLLNTYILCMTYDTRKENRTQIGNNSSHVVTENSVKTACHQDSLFWAFIMMLSLFIFREILQLAFCPRRYLTDLRNWLQIMLITLIFIVLYNASIEIGTMVILLSAWELVILIGHHPRMSIGVEMFRTVSFNFVRFLSPYLFLIFAFALIFYTFFNEDTHFSNIARAFFQTIIMSTSEFNADNIPFLSHPVWSRFAFVLFIFLIPIVLLNLLNGLAVSDITEILSTAELVGLI